MIEPFGEDGLARLEFLRLVGQFKVGSVIETGTGAGNTCAFLCQSPIFTASIENNAEAYHKAVQEHFYAKIIYGDSAKVLDWLLPKTASLCNLLYLDACNEYNTALKRELESIWRYTVNGGTPPVIMIRGFFNRHHPDFKFRTFVQQKYEWWAIKNMVKNIYPEGFDTHYNDEAEGESMGIIYITPKQK